MTSIRWGILGPRGVASAFVADLVGAAARGAELSVAAVASRDLAVAQQFAGRFGIAAAYGSYEELVSDPGVDAVYIATPHVFHHEQALLAILHGKHVLIEKPFTVNASEAQTLFDAATGAGVVALEAMWTRFLPQNDRLREILRAGTIGDIRLFTATHGQDLPTDPRHRINDPALGGGALLDLGVYPVSFAFDVAGEVTSVAASGVLSDQGVDARVGAVLSHVGGAQSHVYAALDTRMSNTARIDGTRGRIEIVATFYDAQGFTVFDAEGAVIERYEADEHGLRGMHHQALELGRLVEEGASSSDRLTPAETLRVMSTMDEIRRQIGVRYPREVA